MDGAEWRQSFIDLYRPDAVRILDWRHAAEHLARAGQVACGAGTAAAGEWLGIQLRQLKHGEPEDMLRNLRALCRDLAEGNETDGGAAKVVKGSLEYLEKRRERIRYAEFQANGYPIGGGVVESANKLVVEARLKGPGMHRARKNVDPMLALRTVVCSDRWEEVWPEITWGTAPVRTWLRSSRRVREKAVKGQQAKPRAPERPAETGTSGAKTNSRVRRVAEPTPGSAPATLDRMNHLLQAPTGGHPPTTPGAHDHREKMQPSHQPHENLTQQGLLIVMEEGIRGVPERPKASRRNGAGQRRPARRSSPITALRKAHPWGAAPVRTWLRSSSKVTSLTQWSWSWCSLPAW